MFTSRVFSQHGLVCDSPRKHLLQFFVSVHDIVIIFLVLGYLYFKRNTVVWALEENTFQFSGMPGMIQRQ